MSFLKQVFVLAGLAMISSAFAQFNFKPISLGGAFTVNGIESWHYATFENAEGKSGVIFIKFKNPTDFTYKSKNTAYIALKPVNVPESADYKWVKNYVNSKKVVNDQDAYMKNLDDYDLLETALVYRTMAGAAGTQLTIGVRNDVPADYDSQMRLLNNPQYKKYRASHDMSLQAILFVTAKQAQGAATVTAVQRSEAEEGDEEDEMPPSVVKGEIMNSKITKVVFHFLEQPKPKTYQLPSSNFTLPKSNFTLPGF